VSSNGNGNGHTTNGNGNGNGHAQHLTLTDDLRIRRTDVPRIAVVGLGYWGPNLVRNLHELPDADLACVCDASEKALDAIAVRYPAVPGTTNFDDVLSDDSIDAVVIATPVSTHHTLGMRALEAGKHLFVEKPLAASSDEAIEMIEAADERGLVLMPGHTFLYSPPVDAVRNLITSGELGEIYFISTSRVNLGLHQTDVSVAWDLGPHDFSILRYWLQEAPEHVTALSRGCVMPNTPDVAFINLAFPSGTIANVEISWLAPSKLRRTTVVGSQKMVVYDDTSNEPVRVFDSGVNLRNPETFGEYRLTYRTGDIVSPHIAPLEPLFLELQDFAASIRDGSTPRSSAQLGLDVVRTIEAVDESLEHDGARVAISA
jgi:predicted dehydrogenase